MLDFKPLFEKGQALGLTDMEVYFVEDENFSCKVFEGEVDSYAVSATRGVSFRGILDGKMGYTYSEIPEDFDFLATSAVENAKLIEKDDIQEIFAGDGTYKTLELFTPGLEKVEAQRKIDFLKTVESVALESDARVKSLNYNLFANGKSTVRLINSKGLELSEVSNFAYAYVSVLVADGDENKTAGDYIVSSDFSDYEPEAFARKLVAQAVAKLGASKPVSGKYPVIFENRVAANLLEAMSGCFSAENVRKDLSRLKGKLGEAIGVPGLFIVDDPYLKGGLGSASFDGEGVGTRPKDVLSNGVLRTYLHSLSTAREAGIAPTGNGFRSGFKGAIAISPSNLYIRPGSLSFGELLGQAGNGVCISDIQGLHAGLNAISGDFSLSASGYLIENGKASRPVHELTVAGNFFELLNQIKGIGSDLDFPASHVGSPSLWIDELSIAGE